MPEPLDVLAVMAHPDDAELLCGGALAKSADRGERVGILDLTAGERGTRGSAGQRAREAEEAASVLGVAVRRNAGLEDAGLRNDTESLRTVVALLRELRPRVVVTHWREGRHPDHRMAAELTFDASFLAGLSNYDAAGEPHRPFKVVHATAYREGVQPTFVVDVTEQMDRKMRALECYASQFEGKTGMGEVYAGGNRPFYDQVKTWCAAYGSLIRAGYGEPFRTRETFEAETLGALPVSSF